MFKSIIKIAAATALVAGIHSVLASKAAKKKASELFGERTRNGLYRPLYNGLAIATFGALGLYALRLPNRELYKIRRPFSWLMHSVQFFPALFSVWGARNRVFKVRRRAERRCARNRTIVYSSRTGRSGTDS